MDSLNRCFISRSIHCTPAANSFKFGNLKIQLSTKKARIPSDPVKLGFGKYFASHMIDIDWDSRHGWFEPKILPFQNFSIHPGAKALHYAMTCFEGFKAYRGVDGKIRIFRPELNMERMKRSARRSALPDFDIRESLLLIDELIRTDSQYVPESDQSSLYIRPFMFATEPQIGVSETLQAKWSCFATITGSYFDYNNVGTKLKLVFILSVIRVSDFWQIPNTSDRGKEASVSTKWDATTLQPLLSKSLLDFTVFTTLPNTSRMASLQQCDQVMWLSGPDRQVTEAGAMNLFVLWTNEENELELITPPTDSGLLLPGITRLSVLELAREWNFMKVSERPFTMAELSRAVHENRVHEFFTSGTAAVVGPVGEILHVDKENDINEKLVIPTLQSKYQLQVKLRQTLEDIYYGRVEKSEWQRVVEL